MKIHMQNKDTRTDSDFLKGDIVYLVPNNRCRLLDGRRTPGMIQDVDIEHAMFTFLIGDYEDKGKTWTLYAEDATKFQFEQDSQQLNKDTFLQLSNQLKKYQQPLIIKTNPQEKQTTIQKIETLKKDILSFLEEQNIFPPYQEQSPSLQQALLTYMDKQNMKEIELEISSQMVINPNSGEQAKAIAMALAHLGIKPYKGTILRITPFDQVNLQNYLLHRLAFTRVLHKEPFSVYRGMSSESHYKTLHRTFLSYTDSLEVAKAFTEFENPRYKSVYLLKKETKVDELFMTHYETKAFHDTYQEKEVILLHLEHIII